MDIFTLNLRRTILILTVTVTVLSCTKPEGLLTSDLRCEDLENPQGINTLQPRFSWKNKSGRQGTEQSGYQVLVASDARLLNKNDADLWDSGKITSPSGLLIPYQGVPLSAGQLYYWKVRVWDEQGNSSPWSEVSRFSTGLLKQKDWMASYIGLSSEMGSDNCPQFGRSFFMETIGENETFLMHLNSLGYHEVFVNGEMISDVVLSPAVSQFDKRSIAVTYDVTPFLKEGQNSLIIWMGSGWYTEGLPGVVAGGPFVRAQLERVSKNEKEIVLATDSKWVGRNSEYTRIGDWRSGRYGGEKITGNLETRNTVFNDPDALKWEDVFIAAVPDHEVTPQMVEPNRIKDTIIPVKIQELEDSSFLVDMGKNLTGWFEISFSGLAESQEIVLEYCDHLNENNQIVQQGQTDMYVASGHGREIFKNKFNYHGFRYVKISNLEKAPALDSIKAYLIHPDFDFTAEFECSDDALNNIHDMVFYTLRCLSLGGYLVDCPQIERLGYGGDGNASTETAQIMFNLSPLYKNWLQAWADVIRENGSMPHTAPNPWAAGGGPYWCSFIVSASWKTWLNYGDIRIVEKYYPVMQKWLEYVDEYTVDGLLKRWPDTDYRNWYLGDWATPEGVDQTAQSSVDLVSNCAVSVSFDQMRKIASVLGKPDDSEFYAGKRDQLNERIHQTFFDEQNQSYGTGSQIDLLYPMLAGVVPDNLLRNVQENLMQSTETKYEGHLACGLVGIPVMMEWAKTAGNPDFIYSMLKKKSYPGYLYMLENGATATWEHWDGKRSRIHNCYNGVGQWFYQVVGGIRALDGEVAYKRFYIDPQIPEGVTWAKSEVETPRGTIRVDWKLSGDNMEMDVEVPVGSTAILCLPPASEDVNVNQEPLRHAADTLNLQSGSYLVEYIHKNMK